MLKCGHVKWQLTWNRKVRFIVETVMILQVSDANMADDYVAGTKSDGTSIMVMLASSTEFTANLTLLSTGTWDKVYSH